MSDADEDWTLTDARLAEVMAMVEANPCPRTAMCVNEVERTQFALHIIADKALRELQQLRAAKAADRERIRSVVMAAFSTEVKPADLVQSDLHEGAAGCVANRVADALAVPVRPELTEQERCHLLSIKSQFPHSSALWSDEMATLDRLLERTP